MTKRFQYSEEDMKNALDAVSHGMPVLRASKLYHVPKTTLLYKHKGVYPVERKIGPDTVLSKNEENLLVQWIFHLADAGFPVTKTQLLDSVELLLKQLKRPNNFSNGRPGRHWYEAFLRRHPEVSLRVSQNLSKPRSSVSEESIRKWFSEVQIHLDSKSISTNDPLCVFNCDETALFLSPKESKVMVKKGEKTVYNFVNNDEKECITTLVVTNACGMMPPPMVMFSYQRIPKTIIKDMPGKWGVGRSESGWMTGESFFEYIANVFFPWIQENLIPLPIILYVDGHSSHLTMALSDFCVKNQIELIALYPNSTHILQPLDVAFFHPLKVAWKKLVHNWRMENNGARLRREQFAPLLKKAIDKVKATEIMPNGFRTCGLFPLDPDAVNYAKFFKNNNVELEKKLETIISDVNQNQAHQEAMKHLEFVEGRICPEILHNFKQCDGTWCGRIEDESLFNFWKGIVCLIDKGKEDMELGGAEQIRSGNDEVIGSDESLAAESFEEDGTFGVGESLVDEAEEGEKESVGNDVELTFENDNNWLNSLLGDEEVITFKKNDDGTLQVDNGSNLSEDEPNGDSLQQDQKKDSALVSDNISDASLNRRVENSPIESRNEDHSQRSQQSPSTPDTEMSKINTNPKIPTPFKKALFWPEPSNSSKNVKNKKQKLPSVATSDTWREYYRKKEEEKQNLLLAKEERKRKREEKKEDKEKEKATKKRALQKKSGLKKQHTIKKTTTAENNKDEQEDMEGKEDCHCIYCDGLFSQSEEDWIMCQACHEWAHEECAGVEDQQDEFVCEFCY